MCLHQYKLSKKYELQKNMFADLYMIRITDALMNIMTCYVFKK